MKKSFRGVVSVLLLLGANADVLTAGPAGLPIVFDSKQGLFIISERQKRPIESTFSLQSWESSKDFILVVEILEQEWQNDRWTDQFRQTMELDLQQRTVLHYLIEAWDGSQWLVQERMTAKRDEVGRVIETKYERYENGQWLSNMVVATSYRLDGKTAETITQIDSNHDGFVENSTKTEYVYDDHGYLTTEKLYLWQISFWKNTQNTIYVNNDKGWVVDRYHELVLDTGGTMPISKTSYEYDVFGNVLIQTNFNVDFLSLTFVPSSRQLSTYDGAGRHVEIIDQKWNGTAWVNDHRQLSTYDAAGNETLWVYQEWQGSNWADIQRIITQFNAENQPTEMVDQVFEGVWRNRGRKVFTYRLESQVVADPRMPKDFVLFNYPNPFNSSTVIAFSLPSPMAVSLDVWDANGRRVSTLLQQAAVTTGRHEVHWDGTDDVHRPLAAGVYFVKLAGDGITQILPILLVK